MTETETKIVDDILEALDVKPGDTIVIRTPQFTRTDGTTPAEADDAMFARLTKMSKEELKNLGLREWGENGLWLFPGEWFLQIPLGYPVLCINGKVSAWDPKTHDNDTRFGLLAYGIVPDFEKGEK